MNLVKALRHSALRLPIVLIAAMVWVAISNHCALGALKPPAKAPMSCHGSPSKGDVPVKHGKSDEVECCKVLRATLATNAKPMAPFHESLLIAYNYFAGLVLLPDSSQQNRIFEWDTGPPGGSFAESVLQRSILAHAPPLSLG